MSGGSYDYMCFHVEELITRRDQLKRMADQLDELGHVQASIDTTVVLSCVDAIRALAEKLERVWYAVEWYDSHDWSAEQVEKEVAEYMRARDA